MAQGRHSARESGAERGRRAARKPHRRGAEPSATERDEGALLAQAGQPVDERRAADLPSSPAPLPTGDEAPTSVSTFDPETGAHVTTQVPLDSARFGRAWVDPEPGPYFSLPRQYDSDGGGHFVPGEGKSRGWARPVLALLLIVALGVGATAFVTYGMELWGGRSVPGVVGVSEGSARASIEARGLVVAVEQRAVDDGVGFVLESDPVAGERVEEGATVTIYVGVARVIPQVVGLGEADARAALIAAGATDLVVTYRASDAPEGSVIAVSPGEGATFTSRDEVELTVAQAFTVPDVVGKLEAEAVELVRAEGLSPNVVQVASDEPTGTVVECEPAVGTKLESGAEVELRVASALPTDPLHLVKYFGAPSAEVADYLAEQGFYLQAGVTGEGGQAEARYVSDELGTLSFSAEPFLRSAGTRAAGTEAGSSGGGGNPLASGAGIAGVRWDASGDEVPSGTSRVSDEALAAVMERCGLKGERDSCTQDSVHLPEGTQASDLRFSCTYGELNGYAWTVLLVGGDSPRVAVTCAPRSMYDEYDLAPFDGDICSMVAYSDLYASAG